MIDIIKTAAQAQRAETGGRLSSCRIVGLYDGGYPPVLHIHYSGFRRVPLPGGDTPDGVTGMGGEAHPDEIILLPPQKLDDLERQIVSAAWALGAWDIARIEHPPLPPGADPMLAKWGIIIQFGDSEMISRAAKRGWITWSWRPTWGSIRLHHNKDKTLDSDGGRLSPLSPRHMPRLRAIDGWPAGEKLAYNVEFRLGRDNHPNRGKR